MKKKNKRILGLVSWLPVCIVAAYIYHSTSDRNEHLSPGKTGNTIGIIKEFRDIYRSPPEFIYSYQASGQTYEGSYFLENEFIYLTVDI